jgi:hypothetical protein
MAVSNCSHIYFLCHPVILELEIHMTGQEYILGANFKWWVLDHTQLRNASNPKIGEPVPGKRNVALSVFGSPLTSTIFILIYRCQETAGFGRMGKYMNRWRRLQPFALGRTVGQWEARLFELNCSLDGNLQMSFNAWEHSHMTLVR